MDENDRGDFDPITQEGAPATSTTSLPTGQSEEADYQAASNDVKKYDRGVPPDYHKKNGSNRTIYIVAAIVVAVILIAGLFYLLTKHKGGKAVKSSQSTSQSASSAGSTGSTPSSIFNSQTKTYTSANFNLSFAYPEDWTISDVAGSGILKVSSPLVKINTGNGIVVMSIRDKSQPLSEFDKGSGTAIADSTKITYTAPTQNQRASSYLTYLAYSGSTDLSGIYVTGNNGYVKGQSVPEADIAQVDPVICVTFSQSGKQVDISPTMINNTQFMTPLITMLKSLAIN